MTSSRFLWSVLLTLVVGVGLVVGTSYDLNSYGLFGHVENRAYTAYRGERTTKYLFAYNYIPSNFDSLLVGASISLNWNTKRITSNRIYNASISGANISEERLIADQVMQRRRLNWLVVALHPYLTMTYGRRTEYMTPSEYWSAFGSVSLFFLEASQILVQHGLADDHHNEYGDSDYSEGLSLAASRAAMNSYISERRRTGTRSRNFNVVPGAFDDLRALLRRATNQGTHILLVYPPVYRERFEVERSDWEGYWAQVRPLFPDHASLINFNATEFDGIRGDLENFQDSGHLSRKCADEIVDEIGRFIVKTDSSR